MICPCPLLATPPLSWLGHICLLDIRPKKWGLLRPAVVGATRAAVPWRPHLEQRWGDVFPLFSVLWSLPLTCLTLAPGSSLASWASPLPPSPCCCGRVLFAETQVWSQLLILAFKAFHDLPGFFLSEYLASLTPPPLRLRTPPWSPPRVTSLHDHPCLTWCWHSGFFLKGKVQDVASGTV